MFISAQTGRGKNYFIENTLIPYIDDLNYTYATSFKILIISNRLSLKMQIKNRIYEGEDSAEEFFKYKDNVDVITYQGIINRQKKLQYDQYGSQQKYLYVICDEAHFFTSDAMFNPYTQEILDSIIDIFKNAIRIYMSATPKECLKVICEREYEKEYNMSPGYPVPIELLIYGFKSDYSYLDIYSFSDENKLYSTIIKSVKSGEKWLIFLDNKKKCEALRDNLINFWSECSTQEQNNETEEKAQSKKKTAKMKGVDVSKIEKKILVVSAESKKDENYIRMVKNEKLDKEKYILISTSVLDNGVNFNGIKNIVVFDTDIVKCIQMVGRARVDRNNPNDRKTLYMKRHSIEDIKAKINNLQLHLKMIHEYDICIKKSEPQNTPRPFLEKYIYSGGTLHQNFINLFHPSKEDPYIPKLNEMIPPLIDFYLKTYQAALEEMEQEKSEGKTIGQAYAKEQISWFEKEYSEDYDLDLIDYNKKLKDFIAFLEEHLDKEISPEEQKKFQEKFKILHDAIFGPTNRNNPEEYGKASMNNALSKHHLPYILNSDIKKVDGHRLTHWILKRNPNNTTESSYDYVTVEAIEEILNS